MTEFEKKQLKYSRILTMAVVALLVIVLLTAAVLLGTLFRYNSRIDRIVTDLETVTTQLGQLDVEHLVATVNDFSDELADVDVESIVSSLESLTQQLDAIPWAEVAENINGLAVTAQESLGQVEKSLGGAITALNTLDIEKLNQAIGDLQAVIEPLAAFANRFR